MICKVIVFGALKFITNNRLQIGADLQKSPPERHATNVSGYLWKV